jgi:CobQ-like glutamine amidotransferase family enzyme
MKPAGDVAKGEGPEGGDDAECGLVAKATVAYYLMR